jgi:hypothetical protein
MLRPRPGRSSPVVSPRRPTTCHCRLASLRPRHLPKPGGVGFPQRPPPYLRTTRRALSAWPIRRVNSRREPTPTASSPIPAPHPSAGLDWLRRQSIRGRVPRRNLHLSINNVAVARNRPPDNLFREPYCSQAALARAAGSASGQQRGERVGPVGRDGSDTPRELS